MSATSLDLSQIKTDALSAAASFRTLIGLGTGNTPTFLALALSGQSLTGSQATSLIDASATWNTTGTPTAFKLNVTDTASNASSLLMDLRTNNSSMFSIRKNGWVELGNPVINNASLLQLAAGGSARLQIGASYVWALQPLWLTRSDVVLLGEDAGVFAQRNSTNAQRFNLYGTYTDASNYRRLYLNSTTAGAFTLGVEGAGTGASGNTLAIAAGSLTIPGTLSTVNATLLSPSGGYHIFHDGQSAQGLVVSHTNYDPDTAAFISNTRNVHSVQGVFAFGNGTYWQSDVVLKRTSANTISVLRGNFSTPGNFVSGTTSITPASLTGSSATSALDIAQTWNTTGIPTLIKANVVDTASSSGSLLMDLQTGGVSQFRVAKNGRIVAQTLTIGTGGQTNVSTNTAFGFETLNSASLTGGANVGIGYQALRACTSGFWNTAVGHSALLAATSGWANTALGLQAAVNLTSGTANTAIGMNALQSVGTTSCHTAIGRGALSSVGLGSNNTAIGCDCGNTITTGSSNIAIGNNVQVDSATASNQINIGNHYYHNRAFLYNTFTDSSNYERLSLSFATYSLSRFAILRAESAGTGSADIGVVLGPKGTGAIVGQMPDGTVSGGNARGFHAVDLQTLRNANTQVASGSYSVIGGGVVNTSSGDYSTVGGGVLNTSSGNTSTVGGGANNTSSGDYSTVGGGANNTSSGNTSTVGGGFGNTSSGNYSTVGGGYGNTSSGTVSTVGGGFGAKATRHGETSHASGIFSAAGDAQHTVLIARRDTTDATANVVLTLDGGTPSSTNRLTLPAETTWSLGIKLAAYNDTDNTGAWWTIRGGVRRNAANGTAMIGSLIVERDSEGTMSGTSASIVADDTNEALEIRVTGLVSKNIRWVAVVDISQVSYGIP